MNMTKKSMLVRTASLALLVSGGCGGTVELTKFHGTAGDGGSAATSQSGPQGGNAQGGTAGGEPAGGQAQGGHSHPGGQGGYGATAGQGGYGTTAGQGGHGATAGQGGYGATAGQGWLWRDRWTRWIPASWRGPYVPSRSRLRRLRKTKTDPATSGCDIICCTETTPLNVAACRRNATNWLALCEHVACAVDCTGRVPPGRSRVRERPMHSRSITVTPTVTGPGLWSSP